MKAVIPWLWAWQSAREIADELYEQGKVLEEKPVKTAIRELAAGKYRIVESDELPH